MYISSNTLRHYDVNVMGPIFHEHVAPENEREAQWKRIVSTRTNGRLCDVWGTQEEPTKLPLRLDPIKYQ
jgi:hypothetical protein